MANPFITVDELGEQVGRDLSEDGAAGLLVGAACDIVRTLTEQHLDPVEDDEVVLDGSGTDALLLPEVPVIAVSGVQVDGELLEPDTSLEDGDYVVNDQGVLIRRGTRWPKGRQNVVVTYSHGFLEFPEDLKAVALMIASRLLQQGVAQYETLGAYSIRYAEDKASDLSAGEIRILRKYRKPK